MVPSSEVRIERIEARAYRVPTEQRESDGTFEWSGQTMVVVRARGGGRDGLGYTYSHSAASTLVEGLFAELLEGRDALSPQACWAAMRARVRNLGRSGLAAAAISAVDAALWDLKARLLELPLVTLLGQVRESIPVYGSGGFTSYSEAELADQLRGWVDHGIGQVKMKVGREPEADPARVRTARRAVGPDAGLFVDANGAYTRKQALALADAFHEQGVTWYEEPVSSDDRAGLRLVRDRAPAGMRVAAGEYGFDLFHFRDLLEAQAVDVLQPDVTRCQGITGFLAVAALCEAAPITLSAHTAPSLHMHVCCATDRAEHTEYFHDHVRIEHMLLDGSPRPVRGALWPDLSRPGHGLSLKEADAERYAV